jgi:hypothetical protein
MAERSDRTETKERRHWLDDPANVKKLVYGLLALCAATVLADLFYDKHGEYDVQGWIGFDAAFGFVSYVGIVYAGMLVRKLLMRSEDYYE